MVGRVKEAQRAGLHKTIWRIANDLRGSVDGWDFKSYVLGMLFYRFISENLTAYLTRLEREAGDTDFDYALLSDRDAEFGRKDTVDEKGFYILPSELFANVRKQAARDENLNETLARVFANIEGSAVGHDSEDDLKGLFADLDVNSAKLGATVARRNERLVKLLNAIGDLDFGNHGFTENTIDAFGDAYEYLMTMYASGAGKSGGEFFTPQEVSELLAEITVVGKKSVNKVYDPACGSGSLLLKFAKVLGKEKVRQGFFGQEINLTTYNLARINMFLHDINYEKFDIALGDTLTDPAHWDDEPFEAIVSNPPYSIRWDGDANPLLINDPRYAPAGVLAPKSKADLAFTMHMLSWLAVNGTAAIVEFPGVLYRGGAEQKIRKYLIDNNYVDTVIQLPPDLFFGTNIATCILVLKKSKRDNSVLFVDATAESVRPGNKNKLSERNKRKILEAFKARENVGHFARVVPSDTITGNRYNLSVSSYVEAKDTREVVDISDLNAEIAGMADRQVEHRRVIDEIRAGLKDVSHVVAGRETLRDLGRWRGGITPSKSEPRYWESGTIPWLASMDISESEGKTIRGRVTPVALEETSLHVVPARSIVVVMRSNILRRRLPVGMTVFDTTLNQDVKALTPRDDLDPEYVFQVVRAASERIRRACVRTDGSMAAVDSKLFFNWSIPVPALADQKRIAAQLIALDTAVRELNESLADEVAARNKQYEFYRDRALMFQEKS